MPERISYPDSPGFKDQGTGREAADRLAPKIGKRRAEVLAAFYLLGPSTPDRIASHLERPPHAVRPRISELLLAGDLVKTNRRGVSSFGCAQGVFRRATAEERAIFHAQAAVEREKGPHHG